MRITTINLPNGFRTKDGTEVRTVSLRKLNGHDEDMLLEKENLSEGAVSIADKLLMGAIVNFGSLPTARVPELYAAHMLDADMHFSLIALRAWSIGVMYRFRLDCPICDFKEFHTIDLNTIAVDEQEEGDRFQEAYDGTFVDDDGAQRIVRFRLGRCSDHAAREENRVHYKKEKGTRNLLIQLLELDGSRPTVAKLQDMTWRERKAIRDLIDTKQGGADTTLKSSCSKCERTFEQQLPMMARSFFFQEEGSSSGMTARFTRASGTTSNFLQIITGGIQNVSGTSP